MTSAQNREKLTPSLLVRIGSTLLSEWTYHRFQKNPMIFAQKVRTSVFEEPIVRKMSALDNSPDYGRFLWTATNFHMLLYF